MLRLVVATLACVLALAARPTAAFAQTITIVQSTSLPRLDAKNKTTAKRPLTLNPEGVSLQDCRDDQRIQFPLILTGFEVNATVEAWASVSGASCDAQTSRQGLSAVCWRLQSGIPLANTQNVIIPVRAIMAGALNATTPDATAAICGQVNLTTIVVQFLYFKPGQPATPATKAQIEVKVDTIGPPPVDVQKVLPGNHRIFVDFAPVGGTGGDSGTTSSSSSSSGVVEQAEVRVYCAPGQTSSAPTPVCSDAGSSDVDASDVDASDVDASDVDASVEGAGCDAVGSDGGAASTGCGSSAFESATGEPIVPDTTFDAKYRCGTLIGSTGSSVKAETVGGQPLQNGTTYAVAVARTDGFGNVGQLSAPLCAMPEPTTDFWESYKDANGQGGCAAASDGGSAGLPGLAAILGFALVARARLRRRTERRS